MNAAQDAAHAAAEVNGRTTGDTPAEVVVEVVPSPPPPAPPAEPVLGVCLSGGGSRALSAALGALSGLRSLPDPDDPTGTVIDRVQHLSSVSGGSWASVAYTFLPERIGGQPVDDADFLIEPIEPDRLVKAGHEPQAANVEHMNPHCLGTAPQRFAPLPIARVLHKYWRWGLFKNDAKWNWFWIAAVGELILEPFGLYDAEYPKGVDVTRPSHFFSRSRDYFEQKIRGRNGELEPDHFHFVGRRRPSLVVNFNVLLDERAVDPVQMPIQATTEVVGVLGQSPDGTVVGGGSVQSLGFGGALVGPGSDPGTAVVKIDRRYSLADIAGCSSAFFAEQLIQRLDQEFDSIQAAIVNELRRLHVPRFLGKLAARFLHQRLEPLLNAAVSDLIPRYPYWPLGELGESDPTTTEYGFSDGGSFEDTGVLGMLARTDANRVIAFVNGAAPISRDDQTGEIKVDGQLYDPVTGDIRIDGQLATLFGYTFDNDDRRYVRYPESNPRRFAQVFDDEGGMFDALRNGLWDATTAGGGAPAGTATAAFVQHLTTIENPVARIAAGREVTVLWVVNNRVNAWQDQITDAGIQADLAAGQAGQNEDGSPNSKAKGHGPLENFPLYTTGPQIHIDKEGVNMLAQLSAWNVRQLRDEITALLQP